METKTYYQIKACGRIFFDHYKTIEDAEKTAIPMAESMKFGKVQIVRVKAEITEIREIKPTPLYKMF